MMARASTVIYMLSLHLLLNEAGGADNCPTESSDVIRVCNQATAPNKTRFVMEFSDFDIITAASCQCTFIAPSRGNFEMAPSSFIPVIGCGTKVEISINDVLIPGGKVECDRTPFLPGDAHPGEKVTVTVSETPSSKRIAPYCYVATFPANITLTCISAFPAGPATTTVPVPSTTTSTTTSTTISTTTTLTTTTPTTTTIPSTTTPSTSSVISSSATSPANPSSTSNIRSGLNRADDQDSVPMTIVIPAAVGGIVVIILIIVVAVVCSRRTKSPKQTSGGGYQNEVFNDKDSSSDGIKDNVLYNSMDANYPDMNGEADGHYSSVIRHSTKLDEDSHKMKELPQSANQESQGPVYAVVDKGQKRPSGPPVANKPSVAAQSENANAPVYAVPDKSQSKAKQSQNALYDVPKNNSPVASPVRTSNQDGLLYSEIEHVGQIPELPSRKSDPKPNDTVVYSEVRTEL